MIPEIRYIIRSLLRRKGFALVTVLTLGLGIGSAAAIYGRVSWVLFQGGSTAPDLYVIGHTSPDNAAFSPFVLQQQYEAYRTQKDVFSEMAASTSQTGNVIVGHKPVAPSCSTVSSNFFTVLGIVPAVGRNFVTGGDTAGHDQEAIVSDKFWKENLNGSPDALGAKIIINQEVCSVIGILKSGENLPTYCEGDVFKPLVLHYDPANPFDPFLVLMARTGKGVTKAQGEAALAATKVDLPPMLKGFEEGMKPVLSTIRDLRKIFRPEIYWMLVGAVGFLYGIACLNATNLMLVHMLGRQREISIRLALGGGRRSLVRLLFMETFGLCLCGSLLGMLFANALSPVFGAGSESAGNDWTAWHLNWRIYTVLGVLTVLSSFLIALVPAHHLLRSDIQIGLKNGGGAIGESRALSRLRGFFVILQATFAVILLVGAGLMVRTFQRLNDVKIGFDPSHRVKMEASFPNKYAIQSEERLALLRRMQERLETVPGVSAVAFGSQSLLTGWEYPGLQVKAENGTAMNVNGTYISPNFLKAGGLVLKGGSWMSADPKDEVVINETMARLRFGDSNPVGQYLKPITATGGYKGWHVVGVVGDVREKLRDRPAARVYMPAAWSPLSSTTFFIDMAGKPTGEMTSRLRQAAYDFDPRVVIYAVRPIADLRLQQLRNESMVLAALKVLSVIAVVLTVVGMFSLLAYTVDRRMSEFGIRMALGATPRNLISLVLARGMALTVAGTLAGIAGALALARFLQSLLFETATVDPYVLTAVAALLIVSAFGACVLPALKASKPDITRLLKGD